MIGFYSISISINKEVIYAVGNKIETMSHYNPVSNTEKYKIGQKVKVTVILEKGYTS